MSTGLDLNRERHWMCAKRMSERRHDLVLTQCDVVERLVALGVAATNRTLSAMEHGQGVDVGRLPELAVALDCTVTYLLGLTDDPQRWAPDDVTAPVTMDPTAPRPVPVAVDVTAPISAGERPTWILGPDIPDRRTRGLHERHA
jgi:transcriptional regulator with XRE-family HTH domain